MSNSYPITYAGTTTGTITFTEECLYWFYEGNIQMSSDGIYRIYAVAPSGQLNLGVCRPRNGFWLIRGKIPKNRIDLNNICFCVNCKEKHENFIPLKEDTHFEHLDKIDACRYTSIEGLPGVILQTES